MDSMDNHQLLVILYIAKADLPMCKLQGLQDHAGDRALRIIIGSTLLP